MLLLLATDLAFANSTGMTGSSTTGCTACHGAAADADVTGDLTADLATLAPGERLTLSFVVSSTDAAHEIGGLNVSASAGTLVAGSGTQVVAGELTHTRDQHFTSGRATWSFTWTAPAIEGAYTFSSAGLAGDHDHASTGDGWDLDALTVVVDDGCDDLDGDGYEGCDDGTGADCDDGDSAVSPGGVETCDGEDEDCDGAVDEGPIDGTEYWIDADEDGWGADGAATRSCAAPSGYVTVDGDCDDGDPAVSPDADETCDGVDQDCDGAVDGPGALDARLYYRDADADGFGDASVPTPECTVPAGYADDATDCDDTRAAVNPDAAEVCDPLDVDEDCDGAADDADADVTGTTTYYADADADGYGGATTAEACALPAGHAALAGDCDDASAAFNPGAAEVCDDPTDYNCDGATGYGDGDSDGVAACEDCDDADAAVLPGGVETCNGVDDDCDGTVDEADAVGAPVWFVDADADGWGDVGAAVVSCTEPAGYAANASDCDDAAAGTRPDAPETWYDGVDQDCDGADDDQDGDGFARADDCDDTAPAVFPGADDPAYDGLDADCAGDSDYDADHDGVDSASYGGADCDDADATVFPGAQDEPYDDVIKDCDDADEHDFDADGYDLADDCDDANSAIHPGAPEAWYDGVDQDCDGNDDDQDRDGVAEAVDCDDTDPARLVDCDTGETGAPVDADVPADTGGSDDTGGDGCGCASTTGAAGFAAIALLSLVAGGRRRRG